MTDASFNYLDWGDSIKRPGLVENFKKKLGEHRKAYLEQKQRTSAVNKEFIYGINMAGVELFADLAGLRKCREGMAWVVENVVKPLCESEKCQLVELFFGVTSRKSHCVGKANWFHSYTWQEQFNDTFASVGTNLYKPNADKNNYFWWDIFCQNQHVVGDVQMTFDQAITQVQSVALSIPVPSDPKAAFRVWCLFELMTAISLDKDILVYCNAVNDSVQNAQVPEIKCEVAEATVASDKAMILALIEERVKGGTKEVNKRVRKVLKAGFIQAEVTRALAASKREEDQKTREARPSRGPSDFKMGKKAVFDRFHE